MRILHLAPLWFPVSKDAPGGIETFLAGLIAALEELGCRNTLLASGDSRTAAELIPAVPRSLDRQTPPPWEYLYYEQHQLLMALEHAAAFDVVHSHLYVGSYVLSGVPGLGGHVLHTHHNPVISDLEWFIRRHPDMWFSTVSESQARKLRRQGARRCRVIPNGIDVATFPFRPEGGDGLVFLGGMGRDKGPDLAVQVARTLGRPLALAGPVEEFFHEAIEPCLDDRIRYVGVVDHRQKAELLGQAGCVLVPSRCEEGFGMVSIEAMACGTPVVALANGALPEVIEPGLTGYTTDDEQALAPLVTRAMELDRAAVRARVTARFDVRTVAGQYLRLYEQIAGARAGLPGGAGHQTDSAEY